MAPNLRTSPDFYLPERLARLGTFIELERNTYSDFLKLAERWLSQIRNPVLRPGGTAGIDPNGVHAGDLAWRRGVAAFTSDTVVPILGRAYREHFDEDFPFTHRPYVAAHLETVQNRLTHIPDEVFDDIRGILAAGTAQGRSIPEIAAQIEQQLLTANSTVWRNRATVVARTETIGAYNAGTNDAFNAVSEVLEIEMEKVWLATDDDRTRHTHKAADGQRVPLSSTFTVGGFNLDFPGDPSGPPQEVIQCRCTMLLVEPGEAVDMSDRQLLASAGPAFVEPNTLGWVLTASGLPAEWAVVDGWDHSLCVLEFCRAPLHPGPCKGWKHTLKQIAPGVYDALERARVEKLEAKRKAKIEALKAAGKPIPKSLLKPIQPKDPAPPPAAPGTVGVPPMVGTEAPLSPATEAKLKAVSAKVKNEFDPETVAAKKAAKAKAEAMAKLEAQKKEAAKKAAEAKAKADAEAAAAKSAAEKATPPTVDSDQPGFVPTTEQDMAMIAAQGGLVPEERADAYLALSPDDFDELPQHAKTKILADMATLAHSNEVNELDRGLIASRYHDFTGKLPDKPASAAPSAPSPAPSAPEVTPQVPATPTPKPKADPAKAAAKAEKIANEAGKLGDEIHIMSYDALTPDEFDALPPHAKTKLLADLQDIAGNVGNEAWVKGEAKDLYKMYTGQNMPGGEPATPDAPAQPNVTAVPDVPKANTPTPGAAKAAGIAGNPKGTPLKDRLAAYGALTQADVDSMSPGEIEAVQADLKAIHAWYQKKNLKVGANAVKAVLDSVNSLAKTKEDNQDDSALPTPAIGSEVAPAAGITTTPKPDAAPTLNMWQQDIVDALESDDDVPHILTTPLTPVEYNELPAATKAKLIAALAKMDNPGAKKLYEQYTGVPHPAAGHATSATPAPAPEPDTPNLPTSPPKNTFQEWQNAKQIVQGKTYKGANKPIADSLKNHAAGQRLSTYGAYIGPFSGQQKWEKLPPELRAAIVADLDNMALSGSNYFTAEEKAKAAALREQFTGKPPGTDYTAPTTGQPKKFPSQAAEKAHNVALNPGMHPVADRLDAYKKLSAVGFKKLPPESQKAIAKDLANIEASEQATPQQAGQATSLHLKLTGVAPEEGFTPTEPPKPAGKKKYNSPEAQAAAEQVATPLNYYSSEDQFHAAYSVYDAMTKEDFESLPAATQKAIAKDLGALALSKSPYTDSEVEAIRSKLGITGWGWKPKTAAQKKAEKLAQMTPAQLAELNSNYSEADTFEEKVKVAVRGEPLLSTVARSYASGAGDRSISNMATTPEGITPSQMSAAIGSYRGSGYHPINAVTRAAEGGPIHQDNQVGREIHAIDAVMAESRTTVPVQVWRGFYGPSIFGPNYNGDLTGVEFDEFGYASTSSERSVANRFAGSSSSGVVMRTVVPPGVGAVQLSNVCPGSSISCEAELLLERGLRFRIVADRGIGPDGRRHLDAEVIP